MTSDCASHSFACVCVCDCVFYDLFILRFVAGVIAQERLATFERVLWRACRGNVFVRQAPINDPLEDPTTVCLSKLCITNFQLRMSLNAMFLFLISFILLLFLFLLRELLCSRLSLCSSFKVTP